MAILSDDSKSSMGDSSKKMVMEGYQNSTKKKKKGYRRELAWYQLYGLWCLNQETLKNRLESRSKVLVSHTVANGAAG